MAAKKEKEEKLNLEDTLAALNKTYGKNSIVNFEAEASVYEVIPTGNISIDYKALGIGGFAKKKVYMVKGWSGSNKSTLCGHLSANCQKQGGKVLYIDSESAVDISYFHELGVRFGKNFLLCQPANGEEGMKIALDLVKTGEIDLIIIDSDSMLVPKSITDAEPGAQNIGKKAKFNSDNYPRLKRAIVDNNTCLVAICQYRVDPGKMFGDNRTVPGGFAIEYIADVILDLTRRFNKEGDETLGTNTTLRTTKNKTFIPYREAIFDTIFGIGFDNLQDVLELGKEYKIWSIRAGQVTYDNNKYPEGDFKEMITDNKDFFEEIKIKIIENIKNQKNESKDKETEPISTDTEV